MKFSYTLRTVFVSICLLLLVNTLSAQTAKPTPPPTDDGEVIKVNSCLVIVPVSVTNATGDPVLGLSIDDFRIIEESRAQTIDAVGNAENVPLEIALLIDVSGSVNPLFELEKNAAAQFLQTVMKADDRATIFLIGDQPIAGLERGNSAQAAEKVRAISPSGKGTAFYDTVSAAASYLRKSAPERSRRVIVALTDGEDNWSNSIRDTATSPYRNVDVNTLTPQKRLELREQSAVATETLHRAAQAKIARELQDADTVFYVVNPTGASVKLNKISMRAHVGMQKFADETGGTSFLPAFLPTSTKSSLENAANDKKNMALLDKIFKQLANELRAQYLIQYYSEGEYPNNKYVKVDVGLKNAAGRTIKAREGYYSKSN